jgi:hypothetical protein
MMLEIERRRVELGISMDRLSEVAGLAERAYVKTLYPETASGRIARHETIQIIVDALFPDGFDIEIRPRSGPALTALSARLKIHCAAASEHPKRRRELMRELGVRGGRARAAKLSAARRKEIASLGARARRSR